MPPGSSVNAPRAGRAPAPRRRPTSSERGVSAAAHLLAAQVLLVLRSLRFGVPLLGTRIPLVLPASRLGTVGPRVIKPRFDGLLRRFALLVATPPAPGTPFDSSVNGMVQRSAVPGRPRALAGPPTRGSGCPRS